MRKLKRVGPWVQVTAVHPWRYATWVNLDQIATVRQHCDGCEMVWADGHELIVEERSAEVIGWEPEVRWSE